MVGYFYAAVKPFPEMAGFVLERKYAYDQDTTHSAGTGPSFFQ